MIIYHSRTLIHQNLSFDMLKNRYAFDVETIERQERIIKGFKGECLVDQLLDEFFKSSDCLYLCDLRLNIDFEQLQIDSLLILDHTVIVMEIKNYSMDLIYQNGHFYRQSGEKMNSLSLQLGKIR
ncbi:NERD domain-containing protein [Macrococcus brunensis]|uniref:NERD domain-containing protein n=1 Tax=Macrococcus brunensis TaxID=198483 RepID=A0A4R6BAS6_9STAP|nr:nuclease-related domain-containing protein [Macrococcus brunensis]TDL93412.1 NERD domain-containing protein [Macrococcus brunensis]ULG71466.1 NERD domain-containing protein [Macrococcus brunensis]